MLAQQKIFLHNNWTFSQTGSDQSFQANVPGVVHLDLIKHGQIPNPFFGTNEEDVQWIEKENWEYYLGLPEYDADRFGQSGDQRMLDLETMSIEEQRQALYGVAAD